MGEVERSAVQARRGPPEYKRPSPSVGILDSQSAKTTGVGAGQKYYDGDKKKKVHGRKQHLLVVDNEGLVLKAKVQ
jgi:hypothetical protein